MTLKHLTKIGTAFCGGFSLILASALQGNSETGDVAPIRTLYVTGGGYHDYHGQEALIREVLSERLNVDITVDFEAGGSNSHQLTRLQQDGWHEDYDVVIYNMCFAAVRDVDYIEGITRAHYESGTAAIMIHCAMHTFRDAETEQWNRLIGLRSYHHERAQREVEITGVALDHPIMTDFPEDGWLSPRDEIYIIQETFENMTPLATAWGPETERDHVVMWTNEYGDARVVGTAAGHNNSVIADPVFLDFLTRGLLWTVGKLEDDGQPASGYAGPNPGYTLQSEEDYEPDESALLDGTPIGTEGAWGGSDRTKEQALDGDTSTFFDGPEGDGVWVGLDLGEPKKIHALRFAPRQGHEERLGGGRFQGANSEDFSDAVDLYTVRWAAGSGVAGRRIDSEGSFRYVRYLSPDGGFGNISVVEFYGE